MNAAMMEPKLTQGTPSRGRPFTIAMFGVKENTNNPGDQMIYGGCMELMEAWAADADLDEGVEFLHIEKERFTIQEAYDTCSRADLVVIAGTPQFNRLSDWRFPYDDEFYEKALWPNKTPYIILGAGAGAPAFIKTADQFVEHCLACDRTRTLTAEKIRRSMLVICRDEAAADFACASVEEDQQLKVDIDCCPSVFAFNSLPKVDAELGAAVISPVSPHVDVYGVAPELLEWSDRIPLRARWIDHGDPGILRSLGIQTSGVVDVTNIRDLYAAQIVVTGRLHGAIAAGLTGARGIYFCDDIRALTLNAIADIVGSDWRMLPGSLDGLSRLEQSMDQMHQTPADMRASLEKRFLAAVDQITETLEEIV